MIFLLNLLQRLFRPVFFLPAGVAVYIMRLKAEAVFQIARLTGLKKTVTINFAKTFPQADAPALADKLLKNISLSIFEMICLPYFKKSHFNKISSIIGLENLDKALAERKGAICLSMHTGNYELVPAALAVRGYHLTSIVKSPPDDPYFEFINRSRRFHGTKLINVLEDNMYREALQALARDRCVGVLVDTGALEGRHEIMPFLGHKVPIATGWITLAQRSEAPVLPFFSKREGNKVVITIGEPVHIYRDNKDEVVETIRKHYENLIKNHPEQWAIFINEQEVKRMLEGK